jgi:hypothetical protein
MALILGGDDPSANAFPGNFNTAFAFGLGACHCLTNFYKTI